MQSQNFNIVATYAVNGNVVFVQDQLTRAGDAASPAHTRMGLKFGHSGLQLQHKAGGAGRVVFGDESSDFIHRRERRPSPLDQHESSAVFGKYRFDLLVGCEFACIGLLDAFVNVTNLPGFTLHIVGQRIDGQKALGPGGRLGQLFDLVVKRLGQAYVDGSGGPVVTLLCMCNTTHYSLHKAKGQGGPLLP